MHTTHFGKKFPSKAVEFLVAKARLLDSSVKLRILLISDFLLLNKQLQQGRLY